jgi:MinD-like ATPase involved in chromosome partitioning or flagellar assembly
VTGGFEEPVPQYEAPWQQQAAQPGQPDPYWQGANGDGSGAHQVPPVQQLAQQPVYQQPQPEQQADQSGPHPDQSGQHGAHAAPEAGSGQHPVNQQQQLPAHPVPDYQQYPVSEETQRRMQPVPGPAQSGPHHFGQAQAPDQTTQYHVDPNNSGGYAVQQSAQYPGGQYQPPQQAPAFPFEQQYPPGGPAAPPSPPPVPGQAVPGALSRQAVAAAHDLSSSHLIKQTKRPPQSGWRRAIYKASGHALNLGESPADVRRRELIGRINQPLRGCYKIAMLSLKGGVGKTTTTTTLGSTFSSLRGDRVVAVDANPDRGTLSQKIPLETTATVRHLLRDASRITRYSDVRAYTSQGPSRLEVLASEQDPAVSEAFSEDDYRRTIDLLEHFYNIVLTDCGTGLMHSAMKGVLDIADSLVIVSSGSVDGARSASATLDWLDAHGYRDLVARSVAVINSVRPRSGTVDLDRLAEHFGARCRAVCQIPFDPHLEEGAEIELDRLAGATRLALLELGATVADDFPNDANRR